MVTLSNAQTFLVRHTKLRLDLQYQLLGTTRDTKLFKHGRSFTADEAGSRQTRGAIRSKGVMKSLPSLYPSKRTLLISITPFPTDFAGLNLHDMITFHPINLYQVASVFWQSREAANM